MRRAILAVAAALLLAGPVALAFWSGGFFTEPRLIAALVAWLGVLVLTLTGVRALPRGRAGWLAVLGLAGLTLWSAASIAWTPLRGPAVEDVERLVLYAGALLVAIGVLRERAALGAVEPAIAAGVAIVICYGLSGRLLPGIVHLAHSSHAGGRLEQPITYWNAEGALAAVGFVLCARLIGSDDRPRLVRALAAAASGPLAAGVYLSYSRGAIAAAAVGLVVLVAAVPVRAQLEATMLALGAGGAAAAVSAGFPGVASLDGSLASRERDGAIVLAVLVVISAAAGLLAAKLAVAERPRIRPLPGARRRVGIAGLAVVLVAVGLIVGGLREKVSAADLARANPSRLTTVSSNRYAYWHVGWRAFKRHPLKGLGAAGFRVFWLRERPIRESVQNVHSLELEVAAELGVVGLVAFAGLLGGAIWAGRDALTVRPRLAAGPAAAALVWFLHASIDWDWELPAVTLPALVLAGALIAIAEGTATADEAST